MATDEADRAQEQVKILRNPKLLDLVVDEVSKRVEKEAEAIRTIFLVFNMRNVVNLNKATDNLLVNDKSGAGKDYVVSSVYKILPEDEKESKMRISPKVLAYMNDIRWNPHGWTKKALYLEDVPSAVLNDDAFKVMLSADPNGINKTSIIINNVCRDIDIKGKPSIIITCAELNLKNENLRRIPLINLDTSQSQTKSILAKTARFAMRGQSTPEYNEQLMKALGRLQRVKVVIPFADQCADVFPSGNVISRTYFGRFLDYIKSSAALHQYQRERTTTDEIVANGDDYEHGRAMMIATSSNELLIPVTKLEKDILRIMGALPAGEYSYYDLEKYFGKIEYGDTKKRDALNDLAKKGLLDKLHKKIDGAIRPVIHYSYKAFGSLNLPAFDKLSAENCGNSENSGDSGNSGNREERDSSSISTNSAIFTKITATTTHTKMLEAAIRVIDQHGKDNHIACEELKKWNPNINDELINKWLTNGDLYQPKPGYLGVLQ